MTAGVVSQCLFFYDEGEPLFVRSGAHLVGRAMRQSTQLHECLSVGQYWFVYQVGEQGPQLFLYAILLLFGWNSNYNMPPLWILTMVCLRLLQV